MVQISADNTTNVHYNFVPLVSEKDIILYHINEIKINFNKLKNFIKTKLNIFCGGKCNLVCNVLIGVSIYIISLWEAIYLLSHMLFVSAYVGF